MYNRIKFFINLKKSSFNNYNEYGNKEQKEQGKSIGKEECKNLREHP